LWLFFKGFTFSVKKDKLFTPSALKFKNGDSSKSLISFFGGLVPVLIKRGAEELPATLVTCLKFSTAFAFLLVSVSIFHPEYFHEITLRALIIAVITALIGPVIAWAFYGFSISQN